MATPSRMPVIFVAHGAPLIAIEDDRGAPLVAWGSGLPRPQAVLVLSAHWEAALSLGAVTDHESLVYDFGRGLPRSLFAVQWPAPGAPSLAARVSQLLAHRAPRRTERDLVDLGRELAPLRDEGVLFVGSGNLVHNLSTLDVTDTQPAPAWAVTFDTWVRDRVEAFDLDALADWRSQAPNADLAHPTAEHFRPLFVCLGAGVGDGISWPLTGFEHGSTSRRSLQLDTPTLR